MLHEYMMCEGLYDRCYLTKSLSFPLEPFEEHKEHFFQESANTSLSFVKNASLSNFHGHYTRVGHCTPPDPSFKSQTNDATRSSL